MENKKNLFEELNSIDVNSKTEKKEGLTYLSWAWAWGEFKKKCPNATYKIKRNITTELPYFYDEGVGYMVFTEVTVDDLTHEMWLPVMNGANKAMKSEPYKYQVSVWENGVKVKIEKTVEVASMFDINKTIMRCLTKNLAMFGLGLYIYAGEDLPEAETEKKIEETNNWKNEVDNIKTIDELSKYYKANSGKGVDFDKYVSKRKAELLKTDFQKEVEPLMK